jgi:hypothetical protein
MFLITCFGLGLRGKEVVKLDIAGFLTYFEAGRAPTCYGAFAGMIQGGDRLEVASAADSLENSLRI